LGSGEDSDDSMDGGTEQPLKKEAAKVSKPAEQLPVVTQAQTQPHAVPTRAPVTDVSVHVETEAAKEEEEKVTLPAALVDMALYDSAAALEAVGLDVLKAELTRLGMKCGGTLKDRAERLFLIKHTKVEDLPTKMLTKERK